ncbi:MAG: tetratricopeptide repeat protein, partial [Chitinophagaceae bacterium]|nr:tetratricopeptide repeat protein [Chitinophagaceae bacterium]
TNTNSQLQQADALYQQGKLDEAAALYAEVLKANPNAWMAGMHLGNIAYKKGDYEKAASQYQAMLQKAGNDARAKAMLHNNAGLAQAHHKQLKEAVGSFKQALKYQPDDAEISRNLNIALDELKKQQQQQQPQQNPDNQQQQQKANDQLNALQQEEKRIRQQMQQQKKSAKLPGRKSW